MSREAGQKRFRDPRLRRGFGGRNRCGGTCNRIKIILQPEPLAGRRLTAICHRCCHLSTVLLINAPEIRFSASHSFQIAFLCVFSFYIMTSTQARQENPSVRVIMIGAHPDDCELKGGGTAAIFSGMGYAVKFVSVTNGDAGHQSERGEKLAARRLAEACEAGKRLGITYDVLNNHDGQLQPTLDVRFQLIREIRAWQADIVIAHRPNDYHPDHRYTAILVQDAAYMVAVPNIMPEVPALKKNPVFLYFQDFFQRPNPFRPDIAVDITDVFEQKIAAIDAHESQMYEWLPWIGHYTDQVPQHRNDRIKWLKETRTITIAEDVRSSLAKWYGHKKATEVKQAEVFEICEYGSQPDEREVRRLFPMLG